MLNELAGGIFCAAGSRYPVGAAFQGMHLAAVAVDAISKIEPILDDIKEQVIAIITELATQANVRLNGKTVIKEHAATREALSHNIGKIAANAVMNFINRKVTTPIIGQLTNHVINDVLKDFQAQQRATLAAYADAAKAAKASENLSSNSCGSAVSAGEDGDIFNKNQRKKPSPISNLTPEEKAQRQLASTL